MRTRLLICVIHHSIRKTKWQKALSSEKGNLAVYNLVFGDILNK
jgi:hypothetical protein